MAENNSRVEQVRIRRTPKYLPFLLTGGILGVITALILSVSIPADQRTAEPIVTYLVAYFGAIGAVLGIVSALVADRISASRSKTLEATKLEG